MKNIKLTWMLICIMMFGLAPVWAAWNGDYGQIEEPTKVNGYYEIYMRGFDENGKERIKTTPVNSHSDGQQINPAIAMAEDGRFVVAWEDYAEGSNYSQIYVRGFNANGEQTFADRNLETPEGDRKKPDVGIATLYGYTG